MRNQNLSGNNSRCFATEKIIGYMFLKKELIFFDNRLYYVYRKFKMGQIKEGKVNEVKDFWNCDLVLRAKSDSDEVLFLREITEADLSN